MSIYKTILRRKEEIADGTMAFHFEKPGGFVFKAGQFGDFTLINPVETDAEGKHAASRWRALPLKVISCLRLECVIPHSSGY